MGQCHTHPPPILGGVRGGKFIKIKKYFYLEKNYQLCQTFIIPNSEENLETISLPQKQYFGNFFKATKRKKFRRQHGVCPYILDFYCPSLKLAIELDGEQHFLEEGIAYDKNRTEFLKPFNIRVIRFENDEVLHQIENVLEEIERNFV